MVWFFGRNKRRSMSEKEMREAENFRPKTRKELHRYIDSVLDQQHDYGTCVYAMSMASVAAFNYVASKLGVTGFQASCAELDIMRRTRGMKHGFQILDFENLFYPQYQDRFPTRQQLMRDKRVYLAKEARKLLTEHTSACDEVRHWWEDIAASATKEEIELFDAGKIDESGKTKE